MTLLLASLTIALIVNTWLSNTWPSGSLVDTVRRRLMAFAQSGQTWRHRLAGMPLCRYCLSHWVGFAVVPWIAPWTYVLPAVLLANLTLSLWGLVGAASDALKGTR